MRSHAIVLFSLVFATCSKVINSQKDFPIASTPLGNIQGSVLTSRLGRSIFSFRGIRYGKPPINELRFQPPQPVDPWDDVYNATEDGPICPQPLDRNESEDCLLLNVYTTKLPDNSTNPNQPVIVFIHAGGLFLSTGASFVLGPQYLLDHDIVLVTINYRLGSLGFLSTGDELAPGNNGFKDQVLALKWVRDNIVAFGGDPSLVTLAGYSAGGASVTVHLASPLSQGLFHRAIISSGSNLGNWPVPGNQFHLAQKQAQLVGCPDDTSANIISCLKNKTAEEIGNSYFQFREFGDIDPQMIWFPVIEPDFGQERFLTDHPVKSILDNKFAHVPVMTGITADEFGNIALTVINNSSLRTQMDEDFETIAPISFIYERETNNSKFISRSLREFYLGFDEFDNSTRPGLAKLYSDGAIGFGINRAAKILAKMNNESVYYYRFQFTSRYSVFQLPELNYTGVLHGEDLLFLFYISTILPEIEIHEPEVQMIRKYTTMWSNFARTGNPIPEPSDELDNVTWEPMTATNYSFLDIVDPLALKQDLYEERYSLWENLFPLSKYNNTVSKVKRDS